MFKLNKKMLLKICNFKHIITSLVYCLKIRIKWKRSYLFIGFPLIKFHYSMLRNHNNSLVIGENLILNSTFSQNSIGAPQKCFINLSSKNSKIIIGNNVGISASTLKAIGKISIGNNVLIGSGCLISDNDSHPINYWEREDSTKIAHADITICDYVFIGARCIICKGVTIGSGSVIGAGSIVTKNIPDNVIAAGNPARVIKQIVLNNAF